MDAGDLVPGAGVSIQPENEPTEVMCVDFGSIEAVSVRQPKLLNSKRESTAVAPSSQKPAAVVSPKAKVRVSIPPTSERRGPGLPEVSVSDVRRQVMQIESQLSMRLDTSIRIDISWSSIGQNQSALNALQALLAVMNKTMSNLAADPFKKEELRRYFQVIQVQHGVRADVRFDSETLTIAAPLKDGDSGFESATGLHKKISLFL